MPENCARFPLDGGENGGYMGIYVNPLRSRFRGGCRKAYFSDVLSLTGRCRNLRFASGFLGKVGQITSRPSRLLAEVEATRLRNAYPDKRAEFWVSAAGVSSSASWRSIEGKLSREGRPPLIFGMSSDRAVWEYGKLFIARAVHRRLRQKGKNVIVTPMTYFVDELIDHIAKQFLPGMTWENWGEWHIDHIKPRSAFDLRDPKQFNACMALDNLQPLWAVDNIAKSKKERVTATNLRKTYSARPLNDLR